MRLLLLSLLSTTSLFWSATAFSKTLEFKPMMIDVKPGDRYLVKGFRGKINLVGKSNAKALKVSLRQIQPAKVSSDMKDIVDEWLFQVQRRDNIIEVVVRAPHSKSSFAKTIQTQQMPSFEMDLEGPSYPIEMGLRDGSVKIESWLAPLKLYAQKADVSVRNGDGDFQLAVQEGQVNLFSHKGRAGIESYSAKINVSESEGPLSIVNFAGNTEVNSHSGPVEVNGYQGTIQVNKGRGGTEFDVDRAVVKILNREGQLRGKSLQGAVTATTSGEAEVRITTTEGNVNLQLPGSGAQVNLGTDEGQIYAPNYLNVARGETKTVRGRLQGKTSGQVYVRSQTGSIRIK